MKILIGFLLALFISSQAYADEDVKVITIDEINETLKKQPEGAYEVCKYLDDELVKYANQIKKYKENTVKWIKDGDATVEQKRYALKESKKRIGEMEEIIKEISQTYYNLSCIEVLRR